MSLEGIRACIDQVASRYAAFPAAGEIERAREEFDAARGRVYDDDELYDTHMGLFLEWYVLERPLVRGRTPAQVALAAGPGGGAQDVDLLGALVKSQRSLFELIHPLEDGLLLRDLLLGGRWRVDLESPMTGLEAGEIFEARLIPWQGRILLGPVFCFHPQAAREAILSILDRARQETAGGAPDLSITFSLAEMRLRYSRFRNISVDRIYTTNPFASEAGA